MKLTLAQYRERADTAQKLLKELMLDNTKGEAPL